MLRELNLYGNLYEIYDDLFCPCYGHEKSGDNITDSEACCWCGGCIISQQHGISFKRNMSICVVLIMSESGMSETYELVMILKYYISKAERDHFISLIDYGILRG